jgi:hypothetical protein
MPGPRSFRFEEIRQLGDVRSDPPRAKIRGTAQISPGLVVRRFSLWGL